MSGQPQPQWRLHALTGVKYFIFKKDGKLGYKFEDGRVLTQREFDQLTNYQDPRTVPRILPEASSAGAVRDHATSRTNSGRPGEDRDIDRRASSQPSANSPSGQHYTHAPASQGRDPAYASSRPGATIYPSGRNNGRHSEPPPETIDHPQPAGNASPNRLSQLSRDILDIPVGRYIEFHSFILEHPQILTYPQSDALIAEARSRERDGSHAEAKKLIHHALLLRKYMAVHARDHGAFFKQFDDPSSPRLEAFINGVKDLYATIQTQARPSAQQSNNANDPGRGQVKPFVIQPATQMGRRDSNQSVRERRPSASTLPEFPRQHNTTPQSQAAPEASARDRRTQTDDGRWVYPDGNGNFIRVASSKQFSDRSQGDVDDEAVSNKLKGLNIEPNARNLRVREPKIPETVHESNFGSAKAGTYQIPGTEADTEQLDPRYRERNDAQKFFSRGRVFSLMWHEPAGQNHRSNLSGPVKVTRGKFGEEIHSHILRMVVVRENHGACLCLPVNTYKGKGAAKPGFSKADREAHAVIYMSDTVPQRLAAEKDMNKKPIAVDKSSADQKLDPMSRINFSRVHTVIWNVKVMDVGRVTRESMPSLVTYFKEHVT